MQVQRFWLERKRYVSCSRLHAFSLVAPFVRTRNETNVLIKRAPAVYSQSYFDFNYPDLSRWTKTVPNAARVCFVTFGTGLSYFACAPGHGSVWAGVPSELTDKVQKAFDTPCCVSLGMDQAWFVLWPDGYCSWKFHGHYGELDKILNEAAPRTVSVSNTLSNNTGDLLKSDAVSGHLAVQ